MSRKEVPRAGQEGALQHGARVERVAAPCDEVVTSKRNSNSLLACRWLRARDLNQRCRPTPALGAGEDRTHDSHTGISGVGILEGYTL